ncbi:MAG: hypothetical protein QM655_02635 [Nocardioidaceae bacterium]
MTGAFLTGAFLAGTAFLVGAFVAAAAFLAEAVFAGADFFAAATFFVGALLAVLAGAVFFAAFFAVVFFVAADSWALPALVAARLDAPVTRPTASAILLLVLAICTRP